MQHREFLCRRERSLQLEATLWSHEQSVDTIWFGCSSSIRIVKLKDSVHTESEISECKRLVVSPRNFADRRESLHICTHLYTTNTVWRRFGDFPRSMWVNPLTSVCAYVRGLSLRGLVFSEIEARSRPSGAYSTTLIPILVAYGVLEVNHEISPKHRILICREILRGRAPGALSSQPHLNLELRHSVFHRSCTTQDNFGKAIPKRRVSAAEAAQDELTSLSPII